MRSGIRGGVLQLATLSSRLAVFFIFFTGFDVNSNWQEVVGTGCFFH
jgi:hypothetical protein